MQLGWLLPLPLLPLRHLSDRWCMCVRGTPPHHIALVPAPACAVPACEAAQLAGNRYCVHCAAPGTMPVPCLLSGKRCKATLQVRCRCCRARHA